ncbi:GNAT family N-acetyltransferase [Companilactobacillus halodurans]|uniref:GNAT family N-acetyltransferase n=1 Tax=Companilactobacillus halodurans TaxID=2584183 RepID=A0A5P0ZS80_9LACO|nr:GNAT family N-acetyltransferase [Companilactobacillus halodurans]MQS76761.1 GNAT family N-acetyltransferase [Companilactobacillus halodurans]MQS98013.1 GNAT family N-acetyltransferase [Companilactobacillus halodurans]
MVKSENNSIRPITQITSKHWQLFLEADPSKKIVADYLKQADKFELVDGTNLLGEILLVETSPQTLEIVNLAVIKNRRNQGLGEQLLSFAQEYAQRKNYRFLEIGTGSTSFTQLYLYQKFGFRVTDVIHDFFVDNYDEPIIENKLVLKDMIRLKKELP